MKNMANLTTLARTILIFVIIYLLNLNSLTPAAYGTALLIFVAILDGIDGYFARKYCHNNKLGCLIDTLGDRITENLLLIFFAYKHLIPLWIPVIFVARSFVSDFIRLICFEAGIGTFEINRSKLGFYIVASKTSRILYLAFKIFVFLLGAIALCLAACVGTTCAANSGILLYLKESLFYSSWILVVFNLARFSFLAYDARSLLKKGLLN